MSSKLPKASPKANILLELEENASRIWVRNASRSKSWEHPTEQSDAPPSRRPPCANLSWQFLQPATHAGHLCLFDNDGSFLIQRDSAEGREIRRLAKRCTEKMALERRNGVYVLPTTIVSPERLNRDVRNRTRPASSWKSTAMEVDGVFHRQGR